MEHSDGRNAGEFSHVHLQKTRMLPSKVPESPGRKKRRHNFCLCLFEMDHGCD